LISNLVSPGQPPSIERRVRPNRDGVRTSLASGDLAAKDMPALARPLL
jgi:hypothetical protein